MKTAIIDDFSKGSLEELYGKELDKDNLFLISNSYKELPELKYEYPKRQKPTCDKHHEYVETNEGWYCKHCYKSLK